MEFMPFMVPITMFVTIGAVIILRGPLGKALGERLAGRTPAAVDGAEAGALRAEVEEMRYRLTDVEERLDFAERMLTSAREAGKLPPGAGS
jgi:hypothetical protein